MPRTEVHTRSEAVLELMRDGNWWTAKELGERLGVSRQRAFTMIKELRKAGHLFEALHAVGTRLVVDAEASSEEVAETHDEGGIEVTGTHMLGKAMAAAAADLAERLPEALAAAETLQAPVSFAGILEQCTSGDQEVDAIASCVAALKPLEQVAIEDILDHLARRFVLRPRAQ